MTNSGQMLRAIFEGLDYQLLDILKAVEDGLGAAAERIIAIGGAIRNAFWMQSKADVVGKPFEVPEIEEATPQGAAMLAGIGAGVYADEQDAHEQTKRRVRVYEPDAKLTSFYAAGFERYQQLYPALKNLYRT